MDQPDPTNPAAPELHGLDPGELLARGLNTVHPSGPVHHWTPPTPEELARLLPQYHIESLLGRGGMGAVYKGFQEKLARPVAIKLLPAELTADEQFVTRFEREAKTLASLQHPGIVSIYDFGQTTDGHLYFVMEYVEGTDLQRILQGPGLEPGQALELITQICEALHAAHCQGVIHRDIKPANILITKDGRVKLADFGLARPDREDHGNITLSNVALGTPDYMAPEQRQGQTDLRADIYALGVMLYEMLTGQLPRGAWAPPSRKVQVDVRIDEVVLKALQLEPDLRYQQASEMKTDVDSIRSGVAAVPKPGVRRWLVPAALVAGIAFTCLMVAWVFKNSRPESPEAQTTLPGGVPAEAVEKSSDATPSLRRFVFTDKASGLFTRIFIPARPDSGLLVRLRCAADLMTGEERAEGYDFNTLWEWVQVPPLKDEGENVLILTQGVPVWHRDKTDGDTTVRLVSGIFKEYENEDLFFADRIPFDDVDVTHSSEGIKYIFKRKIGTASEPFFEFEVLAVSHQELKAKYPALRGPGETTGEVAMWIDDPAPQEKNDSQKKAAEPPLAPGEPMLKETRVPPDDYGLRKFIYTPTRSDLGLVVRWTSNPALMMKFNGEKYAEAIVQEYAAKPKDGNGSGVQIMEGNPIWHNGDENEDNPDSYLMRVNFNGGFLFAMDKFPSLQPDIETRQDPQGHINSYVLTYKYYANNTIRENDSGETWLKIEITALPVEELEAKYPKLKTPGLTGTRTIDNKPASEVATEKSTQPTTP